LALQNLITTCYRRHLSILKKNNNKINKDSTDSISDNAILAQLGTGANLSNLKKILTKLTRTVQAALVTVPFWHY
jgi:hypothetical protein